MLKRTADLQTRHKQSGLKTTVYTQTRIPLSIDFRALKIKKCNTTAL